VSLLPARLHVDSSSCAGGRALRAGRALNARIRSPLPAPDARAACCRGPEHGRPGGAAGGPGGGWGGAGGTAWRVSNASIVSLIPGGTEILFALGLGSRRGPSPRGICGGGAGGLLSDAARATRGSSWAAKPHRLCTKPAFQGVRRQLQYVTVSCDCPLSWSASPLTLCSRAPFASGPGQHSGAPARFARIGGGAAHSSRHIRPRALLLHARGPPRGRVAGVSDGCDFPKDAREGRATVARCRAYSGMAGPPAEAEARSSRGSLASSSADLDGEQRSASGGLSTGHYPSAYPIGSAVGADERVSIGSGGGGGGGAAAGPWEGACPPAAGGESWDGPPAVDAEWLAREAPGLVLACRAGAGGGGSGGGSEGAAGALARAGLAAGPAGPRLLVLDPRTLADVLEAILEVGEAAGAAGEAARLVERMRARLRAVAAAAVRAPRRPRCVTLTALGGRPAGGGAWLAELEELAGAAPERPEAAGGGGGAAPLSWDAVREYAPEVLVLAPEGPPGAALAGVGALAGLPGWWALPAVKAGRVFLTDGAPLTRPGPRLAEGAEALCRMLAPEQAAWRCPDKAVLKLALHGGQRCRQRLLANYFQPYA